MEKPFVKLFASPRCKYFYDVNKNEIVKITDNTYSLLDDFLPQDTVDQNQDISDLIKYGYLSSNTVKKIKHNETDYVELWLSRKIEKISLQVTQNCNFRCKYCVYSESNNNKQRSHTNKSMSIQTAKKAIEFLWSHSVDSKKVNISFYGGEPILQFKLIKDSILYAEKLFEAKEITFSITTNGSLLNSEIAAFLNDHNVFIMISLDGPKEINDKNRIFKTGEGTYDHVIDRLQMLTEKYPKSNLSVSMVIDPMNDFDCINKIEYSLKEYNLTKIRAAIVDYTYDVDNTETKYGDEYIAKSEYNTFLAFLYELGRLPEEYVSCVSKQVTDHLKNIIDFMQPRMKLPITHAPGGPCIPGQLRLLVDVDGRLYPCERVSENSEIMNIGSLSADFNFEKIKKLLNVGALTEDACMNCWAIDFCDICCAKADNGNGLSAEKKKLHCQNTKLNALFEIRAATMLDEIKHIYSN